jgi:hypothetical protein
MAVAAAAIAGYGLVQVVLGVLTFLTPRRSVYLVDIIWLLIVGGFGSSSALAAGLQVPSNAIVPDARVYAGWLMGGGLAIVLAFIGFFQLLRRKDEPSLLNTT